MPVPRVFESRMLDSLIGSVLNTLTGGGTDTTTTDSSAANGGTSTTDSPSTTTSPSSTPTPTTSTPTTTPTPTTSTPSTTSSPTTSSPSSTTATPSSSTTDSASTPSTDTASSPTTATTSTSSSTTDNTGTTDSTGSTASTSATPSSATTTNSDGSNTSMPSSGTAASVDSTPDSSGTATSTSTWINATTSNGESSGQSSGWTQSSSGSSQGLTDGTSASIDADGVASDQQGVNVSSIIGITLAAVAGIVLVAALVFWIVRRRQRKRARHGRPSPFAPEFGIKAGKPGAEDTMATHLDSTSTGTYTTLGVDGAGSSASSAQSSLCLWEDEAITAIRIPMEKLTTTSVINRGGFGMVYKGSYRGEVVAVKMLLPGNRKDLHQINAFLTEIKMMSVLEHPRILRFVGVAWDQLSDLCAVSEFMEGGDLRSLLTRFEEEHRPHGFDREKAQIAIHVAHALTYLHSLDPIVLHRDMKSKNILLTSNLEAKISDFGVSRESSDRTMTACVGTSLWMAPEVMMGERYGSSADIFSFGLVLSELDSHELPYAAAKESDSGRIIPDTALLQLVSLGRLRTEFSHEAPQALVELGNACVELEPSARPSAGEVLYQLQLILQMYDECTL